MTIDPAMPIENLPSVMRVDQAAAWLQVSPGLVRECFRQGVLPELKLGRLSRVRREDLAELLNNGGLTRERTRRTQMRLTR